MLLRRTVVALLVAVAALFTTVSAPASAATSTTITSPTDVVVYVGDLGSTTYTQTLNGVLYTETQILATEQQIADMSDRIVYVTETSIFGSIKVIYAVTALAQVGIENGTYLYQTVMVPVLALPSGW